MFRKRVALGLERGEIKGFRREVGVKAEGPAGGWGGRLAAGVHRSSSPRLTQEAVRRHECRAGLVPVPELRVAARS